MAVKLPKTVKALKSDLLKILPPQIARVLFSYQTFASRMDYDELSAKDFAAHHSACKAALAHTETLLKLAKWCEEENVPLPQTTANKDNPSLSAAALLAEARKALLNDDNESNFSENEDE